LAATNIKLPLNKHVWCYSLGNIIQIN
jgi:hypothetical protein